MLFNMLLLFRYSIKQTNPVIIVHIISYTFFEYTLNNKFMLLQTAIKLFHNAT